MKTLQRRVATAIVGLASLLGVSGCAVSEFNPAFRPAEISSTRKQRTLFDFGQKIEKMYESQVPFTLEEKVHTLYVRGENFAETMEQFGVVPHGTYKDIGEDTRIEIAFDDPATGKEVSETQIVAHDGTIDSKYFGSFNAFMTRSALDRAITREARKRFGKKDMEVAVRTIPYPYAERPSTYLGQAAVTSPFGPAQVIDLMAIPNTAQFGAFLGPFADCKYLAQIKLVDNFQRTEEDDDGNKIVLNPNGVVSISDPRYVNRVVVYGPSGNFSSGVYQNIPLEHKDYLVGLGNRPLDNFDGVVCRVADTMDGMLRITGGYVVGRNDFDFILNENVYLKSQTQENPSRLENAVNKTGQVKDLLGNVKGIRDTTNAGAGQ